MVSRLERVLEADADALWSGHAGLPSPCLGPCAPTHASTKPHPQPVKPRVFTRLFSSPLHLSTPIQIWIMAAKFEIRQRNVEGCRKLLGRALGLCPKVRGAAW